jgi:hypothetical protein
MKRIVAGPLWFLVGWYVGSAAAWAFGLGPVVAPIVGVALATLIVMDPLRAIWDRPALGDAKPTAPATASAEARSL